MATMMARISRDELLEFVRNEMVCTIGSADAPIAIPVLITTFREDTNEDILQLAKKLGYPSIEAMLASKEFSDIVEPCYTDLAKGAGNENPRKVFSYRVKSNPVIDHILCTIQESKQYKDIKYAEKMRRIEMIIGDPKYNPNILAGKEQLLSLLHQLGGEQRFVDLVELQKAYVQTHGIDLNKTELKRFFPTGQLKNIMDRYLYQDVELATDQNKNGSLLFRLKRSYNEICEEILRIMKEREQHQEEERRRKGKVKKPKGPAQLPKKLKVIKPPPPPKPKAIPLVKSMVQQVNELYTDDPLLYHKITAAATAVDEVGKESSETDRLNNELEEEEEQKSERSSERTKYTTRLDWGTYTDDEEEGNEGKSGGDEEEGEESEEEHCKDAGTTSSSSGIADCKHKGGKTIVRDDKYNRMEEVEKHENEVEEAVVEERAAKRLQIVQKMQQERKAFMEQVKKRNEVCGAVQGVFVETKRFGRRAREEEARRERVGKLLEKMKPKMAEKDPLVVDDRMNEKSKRRIAALIVGLIWTNRELGLSEVKNMLKLLMGRDVHIDVEKFVTIHCKCVKAVRAPIEPHLTIVDECRKSIANEIANRGRTFSRKSQK